MPAVKIHEKVDPKKCHCTIALSSSPEASTSWSILNGMILARNNAEVISNEAIPNAGIGMLVDMILTPIIIQVINPKNKTSHDTTISTNPTISQ